MSALHVAGESDPSAFFTGENSSFWSKARNAARRALGSTSKMNFSNLYPFGSEVFTTLPFASTNGIFLNAR